MNGFTLDELQKYYDKCGISPMDFENFACEHKESCASKKKENFSTAKEPYIGTEYQNNGSVPRLLFLSLDPGESNTDRKKKTIESVREDTLNWEPRKGDLNKHWYRTHQFAWHIFNKLNETCGLKLDIGKTDEEKKFTGNDIHKIKPYFAHTNSAKCCQNNKGNTQAHKLLFQNCRKYILGEIKILSPHILVTQGYYARLVMEEGDKKIISSENISTASETKDDYMIIELNGRNIVWIHHYHPACYGYFKNNYGCYETYAEKVADFIGNNYPEFVKTSMAQRKVC